MDDELDEANEVFPADDGFPGKLCPRSSARASVDRALVTYIWDIRDLEHPKQTGYYKSKQYSIDHNQYIKGGRSYQSNYGAGLRIIDISSIPQDPTGAGVKEVAFFDVYPEDDNEPNNGSIDFVGSWSSYASFKSGWIIINSTSQFCRLMHIY